MLLAIGNLKSLTFYVKSELWQFLKSFYSPCSPIPSTQEHKMPKVSRKSLPVPPPPPPAKKKAGKPKLPTPLPSIETDRNSLPSPTVKDDKTGFQRAVSMTSSDSSRASFEMELNAEIQKKMQLLKTKRIMEKGAECDTIGKYLVSEID